MGKGGFLFPCASRDARSSVVPESVFERKDARLLDDDPPMGVSLGVSPLYVFPQLVPAFEITATEVTAMVSFSSHATRTLGDR